MLQKISKDAILLTNLVNLNQQLQSIKLSSSSKQATEIAQIVHQYQMLLANSNSLPFTILYNFDSTKYHILSNTLLINILNLSTKELTNIINTDIQLKTERLIKRIAASRVTSELIKQLQGANELQLCSYPLHFNCIINALTHMKSTYASRSIVIYQQMLKCKK